MKIEKIIVYDEEMEMFLEVIKKLNCEIVEIFKVNEVRIITIKWNSN